MQRIHIQRLIILLAAGVGLVACAQRGTRDASSSPESAESWTFTDTEPSGDESQNSADAGGPDEFAEVCEKIEAYDEKHAEIDETAREPRVESADRYSGVAEDVDEIVFHTLDESIATYENWAPLLVRKEGHLDYSLRGRAQPHPSDLEIPGELSPLQELVDILAACDVDRGLFQGLGGPVIGGEGLHLFECTPGMPALNQTVPAERDEVAEQLQAVWRVDDVLVKCAYPDMHVEFIGDTTTPPPEDFPKARQFSEADFLAARIKSWLRDAIDHYKQRMREESKRQRESGENHGYQGRPHDFYPLVWRSFALAAIRTVWRTDRRLVYDSEYDGCASPPGNQCDQIEDRIWLEPRFYRHWKYRFRDEPK